MRMSFYKSSVYLGLIFSLYMMLILFKKIFNFEDNIINIAVTFLITCFLIANPRKALYAVEKISKEKFFIYFLLFSCYYLYLSLIYPSSLYVDFIEYLSVFKWIIFFVFGYLYSIVYPVKNKALYNINLVLAASALILLYSLSAYNLGAINLNISNFFGFYENRIESIFSLPSVFSLFSFTLFFYSFNLLKNTRWTGLVILIISLILMYMAGSRKIIVGLLMALLFVNYDGKYSLYLKIAKGITLGAILVGLVNTTFFWVTYKEYSRVEQPKIYAMVKSITVAKDYFPIGTGPATLFSKGSMINYSSLYYEYGIATKWGFGPNDTMLFYNDNYFAQVIAQYGAIGIVLIGMSLIEIFRLLKNNAINSTLSYYHIVLIVVALGVTTPTLQRIEVALFVFFGAAIHVIQSKQRLSLEI